MRLPHFVRLLAGISDLNQRTLSDARTPFGGFAPFLLVVHQLGPEGKQAALSRLRGVDRAAIMPQETTLGVAWNPQSAEIGRTVNKSTFELPLRKAEKSGGADDVVHGLSLLRRYYFDVALSGSPTALPSLLAFTEPDHITFGSDWPYASDVAVSGMTRLYEAHPLDPDAREQIDRGTAATLFPRFA